ncbi:unnamed protein product, partial [Dibothriocephalus latus]
PSPPHLSHNLFVFIFPSPSSYSSPLLLLLHLLLLSLTTFSSSPSSSQAHPPILFLHYHFFTLSSSSSSQPLLAPPPSPPSTSPVIVSYPAAEIVDICGRASSVLERYEVIVLNKSPSTVQPAQPDTNVSAASDPSDTSNLPDLLLSDDPSADEDLLTKELSRFGLQDAAPPRQQQKQEAAPASNGQSPSAAAATAANTSACATAAPVPSSSSSNVDLLGDLLFSSPAESSPIKHQAQTSSDHVFDRHCGLVVVLSPLMPNDLGDTASQPCPPLPKSGLISALNSRGSASSIDTAEIAPTNRKPSTPEKSSPSKLFGELDSVGRQMLGLTATRSGSSLNQLAQAACENKITPNSNASSQILLTADKSVSPPPPTSATSSTTNVSELTSRVPLASLPELPLSAIRPHPVHTNPLLVYGNADSEHHVEPCKLRQLSASADTLPAFCSFLPPSPIKQVILVQHPVNQTETPLKFQLSFTVDDEDVLESGRINSVHLD